MVLKGFLSERSIRNTTFRHIRCLYYYVYSLRGNQDLAPRLYYFSLTVPPLSLHPLPSLISNCLNLSLGAQGRSWWLNEVHFLRKINVRHRKAFVPRSPRGSCSTIELFCILATSMSRSGCDRIFARCYRCRVKGT